MTEPAKKAILDLAKVLDPFAFDSEAPVPAGRRRERVRVAKVYARRVLDAGYQLKGGDQ